MTVSTRQASSNTKPATRSMYALTLQAAPGQDGIRSLRALLKTAGRYYGLRAVSIRALPSSLRNARPTRPRKLAARRLRDRAAGR